MDDEIVKQLQAFGATQDVIETALRRCRVAEDFELFEDTLQSVHVFQAMGTQWDRAGMDGIRVGLKFDRAPIFMRMFGVAPRDRRQVLEDLKVMETETLAVDQENAR